MDTSTLEMLKVTAQYTGIIGGLVGLGYTYKALEKLERNEKVGKYMKPIVVCSALALLPVLAKEYIDSEIQDEKYKQIQAIYIQR